MQACHTVRDIVVERTLVVTVNAVFVSLGSREIPTLAAEEPVCLLGCMTLIVYTVVFSPRPQPP